MTPFSLTFIRHFRYVKETYRVHFRKDLWEYYLLQFFVFHLVPRDKKTKSPPADRRVLSNDAGNKCETEIGSSFKISELPHTAISR